MAHRKRKKSLPNWLKWMLPLIPVIAVGGYFLYLYLGDTTTTTPGGSQLPAQAQQTANTSQSANPAQPSGTPPDSSWPVSKSFLLQQVLLTLTAADSKLEEEEFQPLQEKFNSFKQRLNTAAPNEAEALSSQGLSLISEIQTAANLSDKRREEQLISSWQGSLYTRLLLMTIVLLLGMAGIFLKLYFLERSMKRNFQAVYNELFQAVRGEFQSLRDKLENLKPPSVGPPSDAERKAQEAESAAILRTNQTVQGMHELMQELLNVTSELPELLEDRLIAREDQKEVSSKANADVSNSESDALAAQDGGASFKQSAHVEDAQEADWRVQKTEDERFLLQFPLTVDEFLKNNDPDRQQRLEFISVQQLFEPKDDGSFTMIALSNNQNEAFMIPALTRFETGEIFDVQYKDYYDCDKPSSGEILVCKPARISQSTHGWKLEKRGKLEVLD